MSIVVLDAMENDNGMPEIIKHALREMGKDISHFRLKDLNILPCRSCGACGFKSPGKCVAMDDTHDIFKAAAKCSLLVMITPIRFGGYSSCLKKAVDKIANLCLPSYTVKYGHLLHPPRYGNKSLLGIGVMEVNSKDREESFKRLVENNALNLQYRHKALVFETAADKGKIKHEIECAVREVC